MILRSIPFGLALVLFLVSIGRGQEAPKPWWNPFGDSSSDNSSETRQSKFFSASNKPKSESVFKLPKLRWPSTGSSSKLPSMRPPSLSKMGNSTKKLFTSAADFINPFDSKAPAKKAEPFQGQGYTPFYRKKEPDEGGMFDWLWKEEKAESPASINDWFRQPNPMLNALRSSQG